MPLFYKEPVEKFRYAFTWDLAEGDTITVSTWTITPTGVTLSSESITANQTLVWMEGGTLDTDYLVRNTITTASGETDTQTGTLRVGVEIVSTAAILASLPGGDGFDFQEAREIVEGALGRVKAAQGGTFTDEPFARSVVRKLARAEIWGDILRQSGHLTADETTKEEDRAEKLLKEYDASVAMPTEVDQRVISRPISRG